MTTLYNRTNSVVWKRSLKLTAKLLRESDSITYSQSKQPELFCFTAVTFNLKYIRLKNLLYFKYSNA